MQEIDIRVLFAILVRRLKWVIASMLAVAVLFGAYNQFFVAETYRSSCSVYVRNVATITENQYITSNNLLTSQALVMEYIELMKTPYVLDEVAKHLESQGYKMSTDAIRRATSMEQRGETAHLTISVTTTNPHLSKAICDALSEVAPLKIEEVMESGKITSTSRASVGDKVGPNVMGQAVLGAAVGFVISYGVFLIAFLLDNTVSDERELKRRLSVTVLGSVPSIQIDRKAGK